MTPLFSIITPSYNKSAYINEMVKSVVNQTDKNWELIIIDDCSTDSSPEILKSLKKTDERIKITLNTENRGANHCRNQGIKNALGKYIIFFDADDLMRKQCLEQRKQAIFTTPQADLWIFNMGLFQKKIGDMPKSKNWTVPSNSSRHLTLFVKHHIPWSIMQSTWDIEYLKSIGGFDSDFQKFQDLEIHTSALLNNAEIAAFSELPVDVYYRVDEGRKNFTSIEFRTRTINSSIKYYNKFYDKLPTQKLKRQITGTLFQPMANLCWQLKTKKIDKKNFLLLKNKLINTCRINSHKVILQIYQKINSITSFHIKGLKKLFGFILSI